jgi:hypothetical protein
MLDVVIPANPGSQSGVARAGIQEFQRLLDARFREHDGWEARGFTASIFCRAGEAMPYDAFQRVACGDLGERS